MLPWPAMSTGRFQTNVSPSRLMVSGRTGFETSNARSVPLTKLFWTRKAALSRVTMPGDPNCSIVPVVSAFGPNVVKSDV